MPEARYDGLAEWYRVMLDPAQHRPLTDAASRILAEILGPGDALALDIGCGTGVFAASARALG